MMLRFTITIRGGAIKIAELSGNRVDRRKTFDSKIFYDQHNKFSVEINCYHRVRFHSIVTMVTRDVRVLNMSLSLPSATCRNYT